MTGQNKQNPAKVANGANAQNFGIFSEKYFEIILYTNGYFF